MDMKFRCVESVTGVAHATCTSVLSSTSCDLKDLRRRGVTNRKRTILLLTISNVFMTVAWYGHLRFRGEALWKVVLASWGIAFEDDSGS